ncbi:MAG: SRPBCC family protein [Dehalococcoidia bacterium]
MNTPPTASVEMLIRRPAADVFEAFVNPEITSKFWFSAGSARLEAERSVTWTWESYGFSVDVLVRAVEPNTRILVEWNAYGTPTPIEWTFRARDDGTTFVTVTNRGFPGTDEEAIATALGATEGFAFVLAGAKAFLEHGIELGLVPDRFPDGMPSA